MSTPRESMRAACARYLSSDARSSVLLRSASFLAERLTAPGDAGVTDEDWLLLAACHERRGDDEAVVSVMERLRRPSQEAAFMHAAALARLGQPGDAARVLLGDGGRTAASVCGEVDATGATSVPGGAAGLLLLGTVLDTAGAGAPSADSVAVYRAALVVDPHLFEARERLAQARGAAAPPARAGPSSSSAPASGARSGLSLLETFERLVECQARYECDAALELVRSLPAEQQRTGLALYHVGRAYFEKAEFEDACAAFERMRQSDPFRVEGLEMYSTALWHLKREVQLAHLARFAADRAPTAPQTWCVVGNSFSLQKDHDLALRFFKRAIQLDENFTYAYTLAGHEYVANEDFENAMGCYESAIRVDPKHYNAWWGMGTIYLRQEKYRLAELHFRRALAVHPRSSVLHCFMGVVLHASGRLQPALDAFDRARALQPLNPQARFQRAHVLLALNRHAEALEELERVREAVPKEASVHLVMGRLHKALGHRDRAMIHFVAALDLDNKDAGTVRAAIDELDADTNAGGGGRPASAGRGRPGVDVEGEDEDVFQ